MTTTYNLAFVDSIAATPTVRLDLHNPGGWQCLAEGTDFPPPALNRVVAESPLGDGGVVASAAYRNRTITLLLDLGVDDAPDAAAAMVQALARARRRPGGNILRYLPGTSAPVFFRTFRSSFDAIDWDPLLRRAQVALYAEPFAYGLEEVLPAVTVYNDPGEGQTLNPNPNFETDANSWQLDSGTGTFARSTAQAHEGVASGLLTPTSGSIVAAGATVPARVNVTENVSYRHSGWVYVPVAGWNGVTVAVNWYDSGGSTISTSAGTIANVAAATWTFIDNVTTAPAGAVQASIRARLVNTPTQPVHFDEVRLRMAGDAGGMSLDITPKGDVEAPLRLTVGGTVGVTGRLRTGFAVRRRGAPGGMPLVLQAEAMTQGTDTTTQANSTAMSGGGNNYSRTTPGTTSMSTRLSLAKFPVTAGVDARGAYRVFARIRQNTAGDAWDVQLRWGASSTVTFTNDTVRVPANTNIKYVDLGLIQIPAGHDPVYDGLSGVELATEGVYVALRAQRVSGSGTFDTDLLLFVPADDRFMLVKFPEVQASPSDVFVVDGGPRPAVYCLNAPGQLVSTQPAEIAGGGLMVTPGRTNRVVVARDLGTGTSGDSITATLTVTPSYFPHYVLAVRPAGS